MDHIIPDDSLGRSHPLISLASLGTQLRFLKISSIFSAKEFSGGGADPGTQPLARAAALVSRLAATHRYFVTVAMGGRSGVQVHMALERDEHACPILSTALRGSYPGCAFEPGQPYMTDVTSQWSMFHLSGIPSAISSAATTGFSRITLLSRALPHIPWKLVVIGQPLSQGEVLRGQEYYVQHAATEESRDSFRARKNLEVLNLWLGRFASGSGGGLMRLKAYVATPDSHASEMAAALCTADCRGSPLFPMRGYRCQPGVTEGSATDQVSELQRVGMEFCFGALAAEIAPFFSLPEVDLPGFEVHPETWFGFGQASTGRATGHHIHLGQALQLQQPTGQSVQVSVDDLTQHTFVCGATGFGKTTTCKHLIHKTWDQGRGVPFMIVEPTKTTWKDLALHPDFAQVRRYSAAGDPRSLLRLNPFIIEPGFRVQSHIDMISEVFAAAFGFYGPQAFIFNRALNNAFGDIKKWDLGSIVPENTPASSFPSIDDMKQALEACLNELQYSGEFRANLRAALNNRLESLNTGSKKDIFGTGHTLSSHELFEQPVVIELEELRNDETKALVMGILMTRLVEYHHTKSQNQKGALKHVTLFEEAHRLFPNVSTQQRQGEANTQGKSVELFANLLAEIREYGEGLILVDQIPSKMIPDVIKNANLKIVHRLVDRWDREVVGSSMNLHPSQIQALATQQKGEAVVYFSGLAQATQIKIPVFG